MRLVCISDTHNRTDGLVIPDGDVLIHAGDFCGHGVDHEVEGFGQFLSALPHKYKIVVAGNHDWPFYRSDSAYIREFKKEFIYLEDSETTIDGVKFYGSPWQPEFFNWAFNLPRGETIARKWREVPTDTDILITHGPPFGILDFLPNGVSVGCEDLAAEVLYRVQPKVHVFGAYPLRVRSLLSGGRLPS